MHDYIVSARAMQMCDALGRSVVRAHRANIEPNVCVLIPFFPQIGFSDQMSGIYKGKYFIHITLRRQLISDLRK